MAEVAPPPASAIAVLRRNPDLSKAVLASGLQRSVLMVNAVLGVQNLRAMVWGEHTAQYTANLSMCLSVIAMLSAGAFGRMGDSIGRRAAAAIFGFASFLPCWSLLACGFNRVGLYASSAALVLSGVGLCSDAVLVLASEVTKEEDRGMAFGLYQAGTNGIAFALFGLPSLFVVILQVVEVPIQAWLWYAFALTVLYFLTLCLVRPPRLERAPGTSAAVGDAEEGRRPSAEETAAPQPGSRCRRLAGGLRRLAMKVPLISELGMITASADLRRLYATGGLLFFSGDVVFDLGSQYFRDCLDLLPTEDMSTEERMSKLQDQQLVSVLTTLPPELGIIPGAMLVAFLAKRLGSLQLLQIMIPVSAAMTAAGAIMHFVPRYWVVPVVCVFLNYAALTANVPLKHLLAVAAPPERVGEAMATLGMLNQAVNFIANAFVACVTPLLYSTLRKPLWLAYLFAGFLTLMGTFTIRGVQVQEPVAREEKEDSFDDEIAPRTSVASSVAFRGESRKGTASTATPAMHACDSCKSCASINEFGLDDDLEALEENAVIAAPSASVGEAAGGADASPSDPHRAAEAKYKL